MKPPLVHIVDDDAAVRDGIGLLCETAGLHTACHESAEAFLEAFADGTDERPGCLVLDVRMGRMSGPELQEELNRRGIVLPVIFLTAHGDIPMTVRAMKAGAADFLTKPVNGADLLERVQAALALDRAAQLQRERFAQLTQRERETLLLALAGHANKEIARQLGISYRTVELHRSHILQKTGAANMLELARLAAGCGLPVATSMQAGPADETGEAGG
ncbi:MAG: response regulator [Rhodocyclaceae bacterium]|jgi:FixJ family two-component response regulator|nr:response regulator [Rhodocyclaceae bacterium]